MPYATYGSMYIRFSNHYLKEISHGIFAAYRIKNFVLVKKREREREAKQEEDRKHTPRTQTNIVKWLFIAEIL